MRTIAIGDIHGCSTAFDTLLALVRPEANDRVILLGDLIDRGPNTRGVIEMVLALREQTQLTVLRGNHEEMLQRAQDGPLELSLWLSVGGKETLISYQWNGSNDWHRLIPQRHWDFFAE